MFRWTTSDETRSARRARGIVAALCMAFTLVAAQRARSQEAAIVEHTAVRYQFGQSLFFELDASAPAPIVAATLLFAAPTLPNTFTADVAVTPATSVSLSYTVDLTQVRLAPFSEVTYRWVLSGAEGESWTLPESTFLYEDDRFSWRELSDGALTVSWAEGDVQLGQEALDIVGDALADLMAVVPAAPPSPLRIFLYPTGSDLQTALRLTGRSRPGGHASPELGVILAAVDDPLRASAQLGRVLPHELAHLLLASATGAAYADVPVWFGEGLATAFERAPNASYAALFAEAIAAEDVYAFRDLCLAFPADERQAALAYAQSADLIRYLEDEYGSHVLTDMIRALADGAGCESMIQRVLGITLNDLNDAWWRDRAPRTPLQRAVEENLVLIMLVGGGFCLVFLTARGPFWRRQPWGRGRER